MDLLIFLLTQPVCFFKRLSTIIPRSWYLRHFNKRDYDFWFFYIYIYIYIYLDVLNTNLIIFIFQSSAFTFTERNIHIYIQCLTHCKSGTQIFKPQKKEKKNTVAVKSWFITESLSCAAAPSLRWASDDSLLVYPWSFYFAQYVFVLTRQFARNRCLCQRKVKAVDVI